MPDDRKDKARFICLCNGVTQAELEAAIAGGVHTLGDLFDRTTAGVGACGGSCQPTLKTMLEAYARDRTFPADPRPPNRRRPARR